MTFMTILYYLAMFVVVGGHFFFAYRQWFRWPDLCAKLTDLTGSEAEKTAFLGRTFAAYNAAIAAGLFLSFLLAEGPRAWVQGVTLALIVATAAVGGSGTKGNTILMVRLLPAALALVILVILRIMEPVVSPNG